MTSMNKKANSLSRKIADKYIAAKTSLEFDPLPESITPDQMLHNVINGAVYEVLLNEIESRYMSMTSMLYAGIGLGVTEAYKKAMRKAFKDILN